MKKLTILAYCLVITIGSFAQSTRLNLNSLEYVEIRSIYYNTWEFRTALGNNYEPMGFMKYKFRSHISEDKEALKYFRKYMLADLGRYGASLVYSVGIIGLAVNPNINLSNTSFIAIGFTATALIVGTSIFLNNAMYKNLQKAADAFNKTKNPNLSAIQPFIPRIQFSSHNIGIGLVWAID